jgi:hypothetical protein
MWQFGHSKYSRVVDIGFDQAGISAEVAADAVRLHIHHSAEPRSPTFQN